MGLRYSNGRRNTERNDSQWLVDLKLAKAFSVNRRIQMRLSVEVFNLLDDDTLKVYNPDYDLGLEVDGLIWARREFGRRIRRPVRRQ